MTPCPCCTQPIEDADHAAMVAPPGRDELEHVFTMLNRENYHSADAPKTVPVDR